MSSMLDEINPEAVATVPFTEKTLGALVALGKGGVLTATSLDLAEGIDYDSYESLGTALGAFDRACRWWIGDWLIYGEERFSDRYPQAASLTGLSEQTLLNRVWMSRAIPPSRRNPRVGYTCHGAVAPLPAKQQARWLRYAEEHRSTVASLKAAIKLAQPVDTPPERSGADEHELGGRDEHDLTPADLVRQALVCVGLAHGARKMFTQIPPDEVAPLLDETEAAVGQCEEIMAALVALKKED